MTGYNVVEYWNKRENPNSETPSHRNTEKHISFVKANIDGLSKIVDFGPGVGRTFAAYKNKTICGYDISSKYRDRLLSAAQKNDVSIDLTIDKTLPTKLPYSDGEFDVAVSISVLLHQPPEHIENIMCELARVATKVAIITWHSPATPYHITASTDLSHGTHCFNHDYENICKNNNLQIHSWEYDATAKQVYFVYGRG